MPIDLALFHDAFYEESFEAITAMEGALLRLEQGSDERELIHTLFRAAHSIKGGASTFGFNSISNFTHSLEALLDALRAERLALNAPTLQLLLRAVDALRAMLSAQRAQKTYSAETSEQLQHEMERAAAQQDDIGPSSTTQHPEREICYQIGFRPLPHMLARRNDPRRLFRELRALGALTVEAETERLPGLEALDPESCYLAWQLTLRTRATRDAILDVFAWTEGDCLLEVQALEEPHRPSAALAADLSAGLPAASGTASSAAHAMPATRAADASTIRVHVEKIDQLMNIVSELVVTHSMLVQSAASLQGQPTGQLNSALEQLQRHLRALQEQVMSVRMIPIAFVFERFPRLVRDLGERLGKQVELRISGSDTELDKGVLERIADPLTHLVRNCIDHGIESLEQRRARGKPASGTIHLHASHQGNRVRVEVTDDGAGLRRERILETARERGLVAADAVLTDAAIDQLIFVAGFSTVDETTLISGRGVGMDVVKRNVEALGGRIEIDSRPGQGTRFLISLPLTLVIVEGQTVVVGDENYIVPLSAVVESLPRRTAAIQSVLGRGELLKFRGAYVPVARLEQLFHCRRSRAADAAAEIVMVVEAEGRRAGLIVDELLAQQQVVIKTMDHNYASVDGIAGATVLGDGSVALILDVEHLTRDIAGPLAA
jgi:two-component system chemotaxis sensor kinase CheA